MMHLTTLWALDRHIDPATGCSPLADALAAHWDHDPGSVRFFRTSANSIYRLSRHGRSAFLRIAPGSERSRHHIERELDLLAWLTARGVPVVQPVPARNGDLVVTGDSPLGPLHAVLFDALDGRQMDIDTLTKDDAWTWGATVGRLHAALAGAPDRFRGRPAGWQAALDGVRIGPYPVPPAVGVEARRLRAVLDILPQTSETYGPIHTDLELDNLTWDDGTVAILDFDEFGDGWYLLDIAKALTDLLDGGETADSPRIATFVDGYREHHPLDDVILQHLPDFLALSKFRGYISLVHAVDMESEDAEVNWLRDLIVRLRHWMDTYEAGLATV
jgi:Ser/Thr protein kinase RdoA (MazF antagonist)